MENGIYTCISNCFHGDGSYKIFKNKEHLLLHQLLIELANDKAVLVEVDQSQAWEPYLDSPVIILCLSQLWLGNLWGFWSNQVKPWYWVLLNSWAGTTLSWWKIISWLVLGDDFTQVYGWIIDIDKSVPTIWILIKLEPYYSSVSVTPYDID